MNLSAPSPLRLTELYWRGIILALSVSVILFTVWCLSQGITTIFMHLYYFPIVLLAYRYRFKGCGLATLLALAYLGLVIVFDTGEPDLILGALYRFFVFVGIAAVIAYLSERLYQARISWQQSTELREKYLSLAPAIILALDRNGAITFLNRKGGEILGCRPDEVIGKSWAEEFLPEKDRERVNRVFSRIMAGDIEPNRVFENPVKTCNGAEKLIRWNNAVLHDESGAITGIVASGQDITEEKWAQNALREMQQFQESVIANANVWISVLDPDGTLLVWNDAAEAISGYKKTGVLGKNTIWKKLYPDTDYRKKVTAEIKRVIGRDTYLENFETEIQCADGTKKSIVWNTRGQRDNSGTITSYIAIGRDVTAQRSAEIRASESSRFLATMIDTLPMPIFFKDADGKYLGCNPPFEEYIGIKRDDLIGKTAYDISPKDLAEVYTAADRQVFANPVPQRYDTQVQYADGSRHDVIFYKAPFFNKDGSVAGLIGAFLDITERKRMEDALILSEQTYRSYVDNSPGGIFVVDHTGRYLDVNRAACELLGYSRNELLSMNISDLALPDKKQQIQDQFIDVLGKLKTEPSVRVEISLKKKDGSGCPVILSIAKLPNDTLMGFTLDITERKLAEDALKESEERYRQLVDNTDTGFVVIDDTGTVIEANEAYMRLIGAEKIEEIVGHSVLEWTAPEVVDRNAEAVATCARQGFIQDFETVYLHRNGSHINVIINATLHESPDGRRLVSFCRNITERKLAEVALRESEERYRTVLENVPDLILVQRNGTILYANPSVTEVMGYTHDEVINKQMTDFIVPEYYPVVAQATSMRMDGKIIEPYEIEVLAKAGKRLTVTVRGSLIDFSGAPASLNVITDITERKRAENLLNYRLMIENALSTISANIISHAPTDLDAVITGALQSIGTLTGVDRSYIFTFTDNGTRMHNMYEWCAEGILPQRENLQGLPSELFPWWMDRLRQHEVVHIPRVADLPPEADAEKANLQAQGVLSVVVVPLVYGRTLTGFLGFDAVRKEKTWDEEDISLLRITGEIFSNAFEHRKTEAALQESEDKFRGVAERSPEVITLTDTDGLITYVSPHVHSVLGYNPEDMVGKFARSYIHTDDLDSFIGNIRQIMGGETRTAGLEARVRRADGKYALLELFGSAIIKDGISRGVQVIGQDITEKRAAQDRIKELLRIQEEQLRVINTSPAIAFLWKSEENWPIESVSENISQFGYTRNDCLQGHISYSTLIHPDDIGRVAAEVEQYRTSTAPAGSTTSCRSTGSLARVGTCSGLRTTRMSAAIRMEKSPTMRVSSLT